MLIQFLFSFLCSVLFAIVLTWFMKRRAPGPFGGVLYFFVIIFLFTTALGLLITPIGPVYRNVPWLSILATALMIMLLIAELLPHDEHAYIARRKPKVADAHPDEADEQSLQKEFSLLLVLILLLLMAAIVYLVISGPQTFRMSF